MLQTLSIAARRLVAAFSIALVVISFGGVTAYHAFAWSARTCAPGGPGCPPRQRLPGTQDYLDTRTWMGQDNSNFQFDWTSSSWFMGPNPYNAYEIDDINTITVNGVLASISGKASSVSSTTNSATWDCQRFNAWECDNVYYNESSNLGPFYINWTSGDTTKVIIWANTQPKYNSANVTKWW